MVRLALLSVLPIIAAAPAMAQSPIERHRAEAVAAYPHSREAFTQGLFAAGGYLYESTGLEGRSSIRRVDIETGEVLAQTNLPGDVFGEGSAIFGDEIFVLSWQAGTGYVFDAETLNLKDTFSYEGEGWGLARAGDVLLMSDGSSTLRHIDPATRTIIGETEVTLNGRPARRINELEWVNGEVWANIWQTANIIRIDPDTGHIIGVIDMRALIPDNYENSRDAVANGIAWDAENGRIFVTGKLWPVLYEIRLSRFD